MKIVLSNAYKVDRHYANQGFTAITNHSYCIRANGSIRRELIEENVSQYHHTRPATAE